MECARLQTHPRRSAAGWARELPRAMASKGGMNLFPVKLDRMADRLPSTRGLAVQSRGGAIDISLPRKLGSDA